MDVEGTLEAQSDRSAAVPRHTHSLGKVMTGRRSVGERKNNELMMTHRRHMLARSLACSLAHALTHTRTQNSYISYGIKNLNRGIVHKSGS